MQPLVLFQKVKLRECSLRRRRAASSIVHLVCTVTQKSGNSLCVTQKITQNTHTKKKLHACFTVRVINIGRSHPEKLWSLCLWRYSKPSVTWLWAVELDKMICRGVTSVTLWVCLATGKSFRLLEITVFQTSISCPCDTQLQIWQHCGWLWEQLSVGSRNLWSYQAPFPGKPKERSLSQQANRHVGAEGTVLWHKHVQI